MSLGSVPASPDLHTLPQVQPHITPLSQGPSRASDPRSPLPRGHLHPQTISENQSMARLAHLRALVHSWAERLIDHSSRICPGPIISPTCIANARAPANTVSCLRHPTGSQWVSPIPFSSLQSASAQNPKKPSNQSSTNCGQILRMDFMQHRENGASLQHSSCCPLLRSHRLLPFRLPRF